MARKNQKKQAPTPVEDYEMHREYKRTTILTGEYSGINPEELVGAPTPTARYSLEGAVQPPPLGEEFAARDPDLDPQYIWRGKKPNDINELETAAPYIYQQEKIFPRMLIEEMKRQTAIRRDAADPQMTLGVLSEDFDPNAKPCFYNHEEGWKNRMILGDSLQVMASLAENERLRGKVQMIYFDPPYGIKFNSNWQPSTKSTNVKDGKKEDITREPEMVKAFRDTWHDGVHSYLGYLRDRLTVARDLLAESGSVFVQISDKNVHRVRVIMDEIFGEENFISQINFRTAMTKPTVGLNNVFDYIIWYSKNKSEYKYRALYLPRGSELNDEIQTQLKASAVQNLYEYTYHGKSYNPNTGWRVPQEGLRRLDLSNRLYQAGLTSRSIGTLKYKHSGADFPFVQCDNSWNQQSSEQNKIYVCQTAVKIIARCMLMCTDPGDLVLDPTCGSGTTAYVAEQWGRRWITIDTSRVAIALARRRIMTAKYPYYLLADSESGLKKEMEITGRVIQRLTFNKISQGFVYERVPHITLKAIANNSEIDTIWEKYEAESERLRRELGEVTGTRDACPYQEWEVPFEAPKEWSEEAKKLQDEFMKLKRARQAEIDASIARSADTEYLYDKPYEDKKRVRVAGPFTVESIAPVRSLVSEADGSLTDPAVKLAKDIDYGNGANYITRMIRTLRKNGIKQARKGDRIVFTSVEPWANGRHIAAEAWGEASENGKSKHYAIAFGPEFGSVTRLDMKNASREALECGFDVLVY